MDLAKVSIQPSVSVSDGPPQLAEDESEIHRQPSVEGLQSSTRSVIAINKQGEC